MKIEKIIEAISIFNMSNNLFPSIVIISEYDFKYVKAEMATKLHFKINPSNDLTINGLQLIVAINIKQGQILIY